MFNEYQFPEMSFHEMQWPDWDVAAESSQANWWRFVY